MTLDFNFVLQQNHSEAQIGLDKILSSFLFCTVAYEHASVYRKVRSCKLFYISDTQSSFFLGGTPGPERLLPLLPAHLRDMSQSSPSSLYLLFCSFP